MKQEKSVMNRKVLRDTIISFPPMENLPAENEEVDFPRFFGQMVKPQC